MQTRVQKWGNSLAVRIPKVFATEVGLADDALVEIALLDGQLVITPIVVAAPTLDQLLAGITEANIHREIAADGPVGDEVW
ncbi:MAG: AbrB/MazE/SpoVT family DNA-binding domain-containing protein [Herpetosiphonaceae bacterium]|nr:AbrB/MazE/SpoVT family DNA-binding domain-containing protein [Herpetosiphonaceae bacterium]